MTTHGTCGNCVRLEPGELTVHLHRARNLKDGDWFGKQDPYIILKCGKVKYKSNVHDCGGRDPEWEQKFVFKVDQETKLTLEVYDYDVAKNDDCLGKADVDIVSVRCEPGGRMHMEVPIFRRISRRQQGHVYITLSFLSTSAAAAASNVSPCNSDLSTFVAHEREAEAARSAAVAFVAANRAVMDAEQGNGGSGPAAVLGKCAPGTCLSSGLVAAGAMPDTVPSYTPTCGLIAPDPGKLLPCHQASESGRDTVVQAAAATQMRAPPPPGPGPGVPQGGAYTTSAESYPVVNPQSYNIGSSFRAPPGAWAGPGTGAAPPMSTSLADSHPVASGPQFQSPYHQMSTHQASPYGQYNPAYPVPPSLPTTHMQQPHAATASYYQQEPSAPPMSYSVPHPTTSYPAPQPLNPLPTFPGAVPYVSYPATAPSYGAPPPALPPGVYYPPPSYA
ncbi:hypothetical protein VaNZ11_002056 [Volvox africanus]|uniref:C2 domain-containing protein n=1 Tax=Volvox africanus TaxID=51714 RepID=A0ABQ5RR06_9CHLO|nr:hypothetical protein VaNZ11_002056 [Volvox africanus]